VGRIVKEFLEIRGITKTFPGVRALSDVSLTVERGEIRAIVGENGAGKSTLMKILGGVYAPDAGEVLIKGRRANLRGVRQSHAEGISVIFQEFTLMPHLSVAENLFVADLPTRKFLPILDVRAMETKAGELCERYDVKLDPRVPVSDLGVSARQMVEILKAVGENASILIMDEPTAALADAEVETLYRIIRALKAEGTTILYISHRMKEIFDVAERVSVLRDGRLVGTRDIGELDQDEIVRMMVGRDLEQGLRGSVKDRAKPILQAESISASPGFSGVSFELRRGEILGMAGLMGAGREEIAKSLFGLLPLDSGRILVEGIPLNIGSPRDAIAAGIGFVTDDRKESGMFPLMTVVQNVSLTVLDRVSSFFGLAINAAKERDVFEEYGAFLKIRYASERQQAMYLSGGNQQKVLLARALAANCKVLVLLEPTRGIDVGAKAEIYQLLRELAGRDMAILLVSSDLPELLSLSDRVIVVWNGEITGELSGEDIEENLVMRCAVGAEKRPAGTDPAPPSKEPGNA
jgi:ABC-type sugar transport system ATPase subunit